MNEFVAGILAADEFIAGILAAGELIADGLAAGGLAAGILTTGGLDASVFTAGILAADEFDMNEFVRTFLTVLALTGRGSFRLFNALPQLMLSRLSQTLL